MDRVDISYANMNSNQFFEAVKDLMRPYMEYDKDTIIDVLSEKIYDIFIAPGANLVRPWVDDNSHALCWFCGHAGEAKTFEGCEGNWIECSYCTAATGVYETEQDAWEAWGRVLGRKE